MTSLEGIGLSFSALLLAVFSASLVGSLHCVGMCGPFVAVYSGADSTEGSSWSARAASHLGYHGGRAVTYVSLGAMGGAAGAAVDWAGEAAGWIHVAAIVSSALVILWGLGVLVPALRVRSPLERFFGNQLVTLRRKPRAFRASLLGALTPLLPCGWLYAFVVTAAGTGSLVSGAAVMCVFWLGTVPALLFVGHFVSKMGETFRARVPQLTGAALILIGTLTIANRLSRPPPSLPESIDPSQPSGAVQVKPCH